jgi:hypothetical protein
MTLPSTGRSVPIAAFVAAVGGVLAIVSAPLAWATATMGSDSSSVGGLDKDYMNGKTEIVLGIVLLVLVAAWILNLRIPFIGLLVVVVGVAILAVPIATYFTTLYYPMSLKDTADAMNQLGGNTSFGIGFILAAVGGGLAIVGGGLGLMQKGA